MQYKPNMRQLIGDTTEPLSSDAEEADFPVSLFPLTQKLNVSVKIMVTAKKATRQKLW